MNVGWSVWEPGVAPGAFGMASGPLAGWFSCCCWEGVAAPDWPGSCFSVERETFSGFAVSVLSMSMVSVCESVLSSVAGFSSAFVLEPMLISDTLPSLYLEKNTTPSPGCGVPAPEAGTETVFGAGGFICVYRCCVEISIAFVFINRRFVSKGAEFIWHNGRAKRSDMYSTTSSVMLSWSTRRIPSRLLSNSMIRGSNMTYSSGREF